MKPTILALSLLLSLSVAGCASTPSPILLEGSTAMFSHSAKNPAIAPDWWRALQDPVLDQLVSKALAGNLSLKATRERLVAAKKLEGGALFSVAPSATISASRSRADARSTGDSPEFTEGAAFSVSWEVPLFGKMGASLASARAQRDQVAWHAEASKVALAAEVVRGFAQFRTSQLKLQQINALVSHAERSRAIQANSVEAGLLREQEAETGLKQLLQYQAQLEQLQAENKRIRGSLAVLCGDTNLELPDTAGAWAAVLPEILAVDPAHLRERPDVRAAEETVLIAAAQVGLARAALWPQLSLTAVARFSPAGSALMSNTDSFGLSMPLLGWFALKSQADASVSQMKAAVEDYRQVVLNAWQEAQAAHADAVSGTASVALANLQRDLAQGQTLRTEAMEAAGLSSKLDTLASRISQVSREMTAADEYSQLVQSWVRLQKAAFVTVNDAGQ